MLKTRKETSQTAVSITVSTVFLGIESVHLISYEHGHVHIALSVKVYGEPEQLFLVLVSKDLFNLNHLLPAESKTYKMLGIT